MHAGCHGKSRRKNGDWEISFQYGGRFLHAAIMEEKLACSHILSKEWHFAPLQDHAWF